MSTLTATTTAPPALAGRVWPDDYPPVNVRSLVLRPVPQDVRLARRFAREYCAWRGISEAIAYDVSVCITELATNAILHAVFPAGRRHVFVQLRQHGPFVSCRVFDPDCRPECLRAVEAATCAEGFGDDRATTGRGLSLVVRPLSVRLWAGLAPHGLKAIDCTVDALPSKSF